MIFLLILALLQTHTYYPETVDTLVSSSWDRVAVAGTVYVVTADDAGNTTFRLRDKHGHTLGCTIPKNSPLAQPKAGVLVIVSGVRRLLVPFDRPDVAEIDPVEKIEPGE